MLLLNCTRLKAVELRPIIMQTSPEVGENPILYLEKQTLHGALKNLAVTFHITDGHDLSTSS